MIEISPKENENNQLDTERCMLEDNRNIRSQRILIVDDNMFNLFILKELLVDLGFCNIMEANNGSEAVEYVRTANEPFDYILTDLQMPRMSGFKEAVKIREIERQKNWAPSRIFAISGHSLEKHKV